MKESSKEVKMSNTNLSRVEDLEKSPQWASLADEIFYLERLCHLNNHRPVKKQLPNFPNYQKHSVPQVQKATSVWIEPNNQNVEPRNPPKVDAEETYRWSWRPKTEFERSYFFDDYNQSQFQDDSQKRYSSLPCNDSFDQRTQSLQSSGSIEYQKDQNPVRAEQSQGSLGEDKFSQVCNRINEHYGSESSYSGTRERLLEIFERNRYLRRKFFSSMPDNDSTNCANDFSKSFSSKNPSTISKYNGFGSTETLTSQSNQSSISSTNDRKSRGQSNFTPELVEEGRADEFPQRDYSKSTLISNVSHVPGVHITSTTNESKLLVNILPGNEVYVLKEPTNYQNAISRQTFGSSGAVEQDLSANRKANVDEVKQFAANICTMCCEQLDLREEAKSQESGLESELKAGSRNGVCLDGQDVEKEVYGFVSATQNEKPGTGNAKTDEGDVESRHSKYLQLSHEPKKSLHAPNFDGCMDNSYEVLDSQDEKSASWMRGGDWFSPSLCKSLPNLNLSEGTSNLLEKSNVKSKRNVKFNIRSTDAENKYISDQASAGDHKYYASQTDLSNIHKDPMSLTLRRVKLTKVPSPLDLSKVNEKYEEMEAFERAQFNHFAVDVRLRRNYDRPLKGQPTVVDEYSSDDNHQESKYREAPLSPHKWRQENVTESGSREKDSLSRQKQLKKDVSRSLHKSCGDLTAMEDLQSPQLVNNYKNSMVDLRMNDSVVNAQSSQVVESDTGQKRNTGTPLSDHVNSISGLQAGTGTTLPSVYGPIPYSQ